MANPGNFGDKLTVLANLSGRHFGAKNKRIRRRGYRGRNAVQRVMVSVCDENRNLMLAKSVESFAKAQLCPQTFLGCVVYVPGNDHESGVILYADCDNSL